MNGEAATTPGLRSAAAEPTLDHLPLARECADLWRAYAGGLEPRVRARPSEWAAAHVVLDASFAARPGPYDPDWKPWIRAVMDARYDEPHKKGVIGIKPSQVGWSLATTAGLACAIDTDPGPVLYVTTSREEAAKFAEAYFGKIVLRIPRLRENLERCARAEKAGTLHRPFEGGVIDWFGAGSETGVLSFPRRTVILDEYQKAAESFPSASGDLFQVALGRVETFKDTSEVSAFSHPRFEHEDIDQLYRTISDQRRWVFDCPRCGGVVEPCWERIDWRGIVAGDELAERDPGQAVFVCPCCAREISDGDRSRSTWHPARGGTGRFQTELDAEAFRRREYIGLKLNRLADPDVTVRELAMRCCACRSEEQLQAFFNKGLGQVRKKSRAVLTLEVIRELLRAPEEEDTIIVPGGPQGVRFMVRGSDVQAPRTNPTVYNADVAYAASGMRYVTKLERTSGWAAWTQRLRERRVRVAGADGTAGGAGAVLGLRCCGIDASWETKQTIENCREPLAVYAAEGGGIVQRLPFRVVPHLHEDNPAVMAPERKRLKPGREDLGLIDYWYLHRHSWVDRVMKALQEKRYVFLCPTPPELGAHLTANVLRPAPRQHGMDREREEWFKPDEFRDDWLWALIAAEAAAVLLCDLDKIHAWASAPIEHRDVPPTPEERREDYAQRFGMRNHGWY